MGDSVCVSCGAPTMLTVWFGFPPFMGEYLCSACYSWAKRCGLEWQEG
jgi:hypothetical protein